MLNYNDITNETKNNFMTELKHIKDNVIKNTTENEVLYDLYEVIWFNILLLFLLYR